MKKIRLCELISTVLILASVAGCNQSSEEKYRSPGLSFPDSLITDAIEDELQHYPEVPSHLIDVETRDGIVTLTGSISNILAKEKAVEIVSSVRGVKGILNELKVSTVYVPDDTLENRIEHVLHSDPVVRNDKIDVAADSGRIILTGIVDSWSEQQLVKDIAESVSGVRSITNMTEIAKKKKRPDSEIADDIEGILEFDVYVSRDSIKVQVKNGTVMLRGKVGSLYEKTEAISDAWVAGVDTVLAEGLKVEPSGKSAMIAYKKLTPKTDPEIKNAVSKILLYDARVNSISIDPVVNDGYVTLRGTVDNLRAKMVAKTDAQNVVGVKDVRNFIKVRPLIMIPNQALIDKTKVALDMNPYLRYHDILVNEENGEIYLNGNVYTPFEKQEAENVAAKIPGVVAVKNNLSIKQYPVLGYPLDFYTTPASAISEPHHKPDSVIKKNIEKELWWSPFVNEKEVHVTVRDGIVTLTGTVNTNLEREYAEKEALEGGALIVQNHLLVEFGP